MYDIKKFYGIIINYETTIVVYDIPNDCDITMVDLWDHSELYVCTTDSVPTMVTSCHHNSFYDFTIDVDITFLDLWSQNFCL